MSDKKKTKKLRRPNYVAAGLAGSPSVARGGGAETFPQPRGEGARTLFDYTYVKKDLRRIGLLSALCVSIIVALSFFLR